MRSLLPAVILASAVFAPAQAQNVRPKAELRGIAFLSGTWQIEQGKVADTGETATGSSAFSWEVGGAVLVQRSRTSLFNAAGKMTRTFDQIIMIYPEGNTIHADQSDGVHVIHYTSAAILDGRSVIFTSAPRPNNPAFQLTYEHVGPQRVAVTFAMAQPGSMNFQPVTASIITQRGGPSTKARRPATAKR